MSMTQPVVLPYKPSALEAFLVRYTMLSLPHWERIRARGRKRFIGRMMALAWGCVAVLLGSQAVAVYRGGLPLHEMWAASFLAWYVPFAAAVPLVIAGVARLEWHLCEEKYREVLSQQGRAPRPLA